ncbi:hypothetical protein BGAL_0026g00400 [Botrytis galanthina]|uniref:Uncharacterized protein n=1 Tax=Botrytis galanthina TaxID=278940 RepID=A0A4S8R8Z1_9HELO|nr:hypothetical protein BGAL_0026g00400 [Botrytis galanthina]
MDLFLPSPLILRNSSNFSEQVFCASLGISESVCSEGFQRRSWYPRAFHFHYRHLEPDIEEQWQEIEVKIPSSILEKQTPEFVNLPMSTGVDSREPKFIGTRQIML